MRLFIACGIGEEIRSHLAGVIERMGSGINGVKWVAPENLHITLKFFGEVEELLVDEIVSALNGAFFNSQEFTLSVRGLGTFPPKRHPQVVWAGISEGAGELRSLSEIVERALGPMGFKKEKRAFSPHVTIGRVRKKSRPDGLREFILGNEASDFGRCGVDHITLMKSVLRPQGPEYSPVHVWDLKISVRGS